MTSFRRMFGLFGTTTVDGAFTGYDIAEDENRPATANQPDFSEELFVPLLSDHKNSFSWIPSSPIQNTSKTKIEALYTWISHLPTSLQLNTPYTQLIQDIKTMMDPLGSKQFNVSKQTCKINLEQLQKRLDLREKQSFTQQQNDTLTTIGQDLKDIIKSFEAVTNTEGYTPPTLR